MKRREFLHRTGAVAIGALAFPYVMSSRARAANDRIAMGFIGMGGKGMHNLGGLMAEPEVQVVAVCDVDRDRGGQGREPAKASVEQFYTDQSGKDWRGCKAYADFRQLLARDDIDAVCISTPDHWHALATIAAADAGKHIYCEKPLANSVGEGRAMVNAVERNAVVFQNGSHERSTSSIRFACELIRNGRIGEVKTVRINLPCTDGHHVDARSFAGVPDPMAAPEGFDYEMWLGHTQDVPYTERRCHFWWRFILSYGGGEMTDRGAHVIDIAQLGMGLDATGPVSIEARGVQNKDSLYNAWWDYEFVNTYANGVQFIGSTDEPRGMRFEGSEGSIFVNIHGGALEADPASILEEKIGGSDVQLGRSPGHHRNFVEAVLGQAEPMAPVEAAHRTASICHLNNIAMAIGKKLTWDPVRERFTNSEAANGMLTPHMRLPWRIQWRGRRY